MLRKTCTDIVREQRPPADREHIIAALPSFFRERVSVFVEEVSGGIDDEAWECCRCHIVPQVVVMDIEGQLRDKLEKVEALYFGAGTAGEKVAAEAAIGRLRAKLAEIGRQDPPVEMQFAMPDSWAVRLFVALCRRYGLRPYRYPRQRRTTIMVRTHPTVR